MFDERLGPEARQGVRRGIPISFLANDGKSAQDLTLLKIGAGSVHYRLALSYAPIDQMPPAIDQGFALMRAYEAIDDGADVIRQSDGTWGVKRGARVRIRTFVQTPGPRHFVALTDPLPAGLQFVDASLAVTPRLPSEAPSEEHEAIAAMSPIERTRRARLKELRRIAEHHWYEHHVGHKDRVHAFASELPAGTYAFEYVARALTPGTFLAPAPRIEEMHAPETFGRGEATLVEVH